MFYSLLSYVERHWRTMKKRQRPSRADSRFFFGYESISTVDVDRFLGEIDGRSNIDRIFK